MDDVSHSIQSISYLGNRLGPAFPVRVLLLSNVIPELSSFCSVVPTSSWQKGKQEAGSPCPKAFDRDLSFTHFLKCKGLGWGGGAVRMDKGPWLASHFLAIMPHPSFLDS